MEIMIIIIIDKIELTGAVNYSHERMHICIRHFGCICCVDET